LGSGVINERLKHGIPLIAFDELALDWSLLHDTFIKVIAIFAEYPDLFGQVPERLKEPSASQFLTKKAAKIWFKGTRLPPKILSDGVNENLLNAITNATLKPFLISHAKTLIGSVAQERWRREYCPICGGSPDFAFLDKEHGSRWLLCSRCDTEWLFQRLQCPYCGTQDQNALAYFSSDEGLYRLYVCEKCKRYLKAIDLRQTEAEILLPLERLYTLDINRQAQEQGYILYDKNAKTKNHKRGKKTLER
jgi:FdhE protein